MPGRETYFNPCWMEKSLHPDLSEWVLPLEGKSNYAKCVLYNK